MHKYLLWGKGEISFNLKGFFNINISRQLIRNFRSIVSLCIKIKPDANLYYNVKLTITTSK